MYHAGNRTDLTFSQLNHGIEQMEKRGISPHLLFGIVKLESSGRERVDNSVSTARGYGQFL